MTLLTFKLNEHLYLRDPQHSVLGQNIISKSIVMIDQLGFEKFTFKKLAEEIKCTEASIYRYFENKHRLLVYLISWYWLWMVYRVDKFTSSINDPKKKLRECLRVIAEEKKYDPAFEFVREEALLRIIVSEFNKAYHSKGVDEDNKDGLFLSFKSLAKKISEMVLAVKPNYRFANSLVSSLLIAATQQLFFAAHLKSLTNLKENKNLYEDLYAFLESVAFGAIQNS